MATLRVNSPANSYSIHIECKMLLRAGALISQIAKPQRAMLAVDRNVYQTHGQILINSMRDAGFDIHTFEIEAAETNKSLDTARSLYAAMLDSKLERGSIVLALGGGIVGDLAGFVAATFMRGVPLVHVPTTLLAMVDASIGGKTAVNFTKPDGGLVKNLVGAFWQPAHVLIDPATLLTLNDRQYRCGLAECVKHAMIADAGLLEFLSENRRAILAKDLGVVQTLIERSAAIKVAIVERDEHEQGERALLNLGHTFAHAIESFADLDIHHGEAVSIGLVAASHISVARGLMNNIQRDSVINLLIALDLPTRLPRAVPIAALLQAMRHDKKIASGRLRLILPVGLGSARIVDDVPNEIIEQAWQSVSPPHAN
jgi:3-dehydroquinate synthase